MKCLEPAAAGANVNVHTVKHVNASSVPAGGGGSGARSGEGGGDEITTLLNLGMKNEGCV